MFLVTSMINTEFCNLIPIEQQASLFCGFATVHVDADEALWWPFHCIKK